MTTQEGFIEDRYSVRLGRDCYLETAISRNTRYVRLEIVKGRERLPVLLDLENHPLKATLKELRWLIDMIEQRAKDNPKLSGE